MTVKEEYLDYLKNLETWGVKNIKDAAPYLKMQFPQLSINEAQQIVIHWQSTRNQLLNEAR